jgi:hypothetical protein
MGKQENRSTIQLSDDLLAIAKACMKRERYRSLSELFASFIRHWALTQLPHTLTGEWAALPPEERDTIDSRLAALVESGQAEKGSWLNARIYDAIKTTHGPEAASPTVKQIAAKLPETIRKALL